MLKVECNRCKKVFQTDRKLLDDTCYGKSPIYCPDCQKEWKEMLAYKDKLKVEATAKIESAFQVQMKIWLDWTEFPRKLIKKWKFKDRQELAKLITDNMFSGEEMDKGGG